MHPLQSADALIVYVDIKSPYAYLAKDPTRQLAAQLGLSIDWRPLTLNIPSYLGSAKVNETGAVIESDRSPKQWNFVRYSYMDAKRYARTKGIKIYGPRKIWDTRLVNTAFLYAKTRFPEHLDAFLDHVYERFWLRELDVESVDGVRRVLDFCGIESAEFGTYFEGEGGTTHDELQACLHPNGIFGVPTYVVDGEIFFGREHLPYIRWLFSGQQGPAPDVAYEAMT